ncbi:hypothetical protein AAFF_G00163570 [Aldrovandia affinis]|uniref:Uncharacterized protein n=1 Tax=Aldrovandia affinis TaxID=143900 RepID=A0AAD7SZB1_9TELE|nr:hypothetical protein AAFF_G00163570 [Aldrovandia affinis]
MLHNSQASERQGLSGESGGRIPPESATCLCGEKKTSTGDGEAIFHGTAVRGEQMGVVRAGCRSPASSASPNDGVHLLFYCHSWSRFPISPTAAGAPVSAHRSPRLITLMNFFLRSARTRTSFETVWPCVASGDLFAPTQGRGWGWGRRVTEEQCVTPVWWRFSLLRTSQRA